ncbi:MAG: sporulation transcription factor Spo0A [Clostridia bacterium]|nr:sporulation transcription factor Spo0A [Clostridia bacterium]
MRKTRILVVDDNVAYCDELKRELAATELFEVSAVYDGLSAIKACESFRPDAMVLDMMMPTIDGLDVLHTLSESGLKVHTIAVSLPIGDEFVSRALSSGARYYMTKPLNVKALAERLIDTATPSEAACALATPSARAQLSRTLDEKLSNIFITVGIPAHIKGYHYLREAVKLTIENPDIINSITKRLYPAVAVRFATSPSKVERAIRHAIEVAWNKGKIENVNHIFGIKVYSANEKPTNGEFIALVADKLLIEGNL